MRLLLVALLPLLVLARPDLRVNYFSGRWPPRRTQPETSDNVQATQDDPKSRARMVHEEIKEASHLTDDELDKYKETMRKLAIIGEYKFFGHTRGDVRPPDVLPKLGRSVDEEAEATPQLFEGDILLTPDQMDDIFKSAVEDAGLTGEGLEEMVDEEALSRHKRKLTASTRLRWRFPISYRVGSAPRGAVAAGVRLWEDNTCVRFQETFSSGGNYIEFKRGSGCFSSIGMVGGRQVVSIGSGCEKNGIVAHEIGHALGLWHEQSRPDRDRWVSINEQYIVSGTLGNFLPRSSSDIVTFGIPYDLGSVMHYGPTAFANRAGVQTIVAKDPLYQTTMGQRETLSFYDIKFINTAYCSDVCPNSQLNCKHSGYPDPKDCNRCRCPDGLSGRLCDRAEPTSSSCGDTNLRTTGQWQSFSSRGVGKCNFHIVAPLGKKVLIQVTQFGFVGTRTTCSTKYLEIKYTADLGNTGARLCTRNPTQTFTTATNEGVVIYLGDSNSAATLRYREDPPGGGGFTPGPPSPPTVPPTRPTVPPTRPTPPTWPTPTAPPITWPTPRPTTPRPPTPGPPGPVCPPTATGWGEWSDWERCSLSCGGCGTQTRRRICAPGSRCRGLPTESRPCNFRTCSGQRSCCEPFVDTGLNFCGISSLTPPPGPGPVTNRPSPGLWTPWTPWSRCQGSKQCGGCGTQIRTRSCRSGDDCGGESFERRACAFTACECTGGRIIGWVACPGDRTRLCPLRENSESCQECCTPFRLDSRRETCQ